MRYSAIREQLRNATVDPSGCAGLVGNAHLEGDSSSFSAHLVGNAHPKRDSVDFSAGLVGNVRFRPTLISQRWMAPAKQRAAVSQLRAEASNQIQRVREQL
jgi:hypothetical protein